MNHYERMEYHGLAGETLTGCDLSDADLREANFAGADLRGACFAGADMRDVDLDHVPLVVKLREDLASAENEVERLECELAETIETIVRLRGRCP